MMKSFVFVLLSFLLIPALSFAQKNKTAREFYRLTIYQYQSEVQEKFLDSYVGNALIPALHRQNIKPIGAFKAIANDTASRKQLYVLIPLKSLAQLTSIQQKLTTDKKYLAAGSDYLNIDYKTPAYDRVETILLHAFSLSPKIKQPQLNGPKAERVYELRSYESPGEKLFRNKVHMFNEGGEVTIFKNLNFNAVFYGEVVSGGKMPNLMYMTSFENKADREAHWKSFRDDADWKKLSAMQEYKNNVSHIDIVFLRPADYSDL